MNFFPNNNLLPKLQPVSETVIVNDSTKPRFFKFTNETQKLTYFYLELFFTSIYDHFLFLRPLMIRNKHCIFIELFPISFS